MPSRQTATLVDESEGLRCRVRTASSHFFFLLAQDRKLLFSGRLGWAEGALKRHVQNGSRDAAIRGLERILRFFVRLLGIRDCRPVEQAEKLDLRPPCLFLRRHRWVYDVL